MPAQAMPALLPYCVGAAPADLGHGSLVLRLGKQGLNLQCGEDGRGLP